jgi:hypothetical protein
MSQTQIAESQTQIAMSHTQIAESQTHVFKSLRLCNHAPMQYAPKQFMITLPNPQHQFLTHQIQYLKFPTATHSHTIHSTLHIQYTILQNIIDKFNILEILKSSKTNIFSIQLVRIYKTTYIFCDFTLYKNSSFSVSRILTLTVQI